VETEKPSSETGKPLPETENAVIEAGTAITDKPQTANPSLPKPENPKNRKTEEPTIGKRKKPENIMAETENHHWKPKNRINRLLGGLTPNKNNRNPKSHHCK
jgi:hypothetical protein